MTRKEDHFIMPKLFHEEYDLLTNVRRSCDTYAPAALSK